MKRPLKTELAALPHAVNRAVSVTVSGRQVGSVEMTFEIRTFFVDDGLDDQVWRSAF